MIIFKNVLNYKVVLFFNFTQLLPAAMFGYDKNSQIFSFKNKKLMVLRKIRTPHIIASFKLGGNINLILMQLV